jgi:hypothetical protein
MNQIDGIKFGLLTEQDLLTLKHRVEMEEKKRIKKPEEYFSVIRAEDGCEGFYCKYEQLNEIDAEELKEYIAQTLESGSEITFSLEKIEKKEYVEHCQRYEWSFGDKTLNEEDDE